jgi:ferredoxin
MGIDVEIDRDVCMGSGNCTYEAPGVFDLDDDGVAVVVDVTAAPEDSVAAAAEGCPTQAITIRRGV